MLSCMFLRVVHGLLILAIGAAPFLCCSNAAPRAAAGGCCQGCESSVDTVGPGGDSTSAPVGHDHRGCEMCQCICAGAVLEPFPVDQRLKGELRALPGDGRAAIRLGDLALTGAAHALKRDLFNPPSGRALRTLYQSFLC
jgi:hypothetical protein